MARTSRRSVRKAGVDPRDEPSVEWGWHGSFPNGQRVSGVVVAILLLVMVVGPYQTSLHVLWLVPMGLALLGLIVWGTVKRRRDDWRR